MKGLASKITPGVQVGTILKCDDNSGAKELMVLAVRRYKGTRRDLAKTGVGGIAICSVKKGKPELRKKIVKAVIIRQKQSFRRANGMRVKFSDNAAILIDDTGMPRGTEIKGVVAKEAAIRFAKLASLAKNVV